MGKRTGSILVLALLAAPSIGAAQTAAEARAFVMGLYTAYGRGEPNYLGKGAGAVFSPRLLALIRRDQRAARGEVGMLDADPICGCQDFDRLRDISVGTAGPAKGRMLATARFTNFGARQTVRLELVSVGGRWRVDEVRTSETPSLVRLLSKAR